MRMEKTFSAVESTGGGKMEENKIENPQIKEGVDFVFEQNPELAKIGTKEQYSEYLNTIFPESKVKDIFYHGAREKFEKFDLEKGGVSGRNFGKGVYTTPHLRLATQYASGLADNVVPLVLNTKQPFVTCEHYSEFHGAYSTIPYTEKMTHYIDSDSIINYEMLDRDLLRKVNKYLVEYTGERDDNGFPVYQVDILTYPKIREIVVPEVEQTHMLGRNEDVERFKEFVNNQKTNPDPHASV